MPNLINRFMICLDSSGSMGKVAPAVITAYNKTVDDIRKGAAEAGQVSTVGLITFGERDPLRGHATVSVKYNAAVPSAVEPLNKYTYLPQVGTPLWDAVGRGIAELRTLGDTKDTSYVVMVITDGEENESREWTAEHLRRDIDAVCKSDRWSFVFLVPPGAKAAMVNRRGLAEGNVMEWEASTKGVESYSVVTTSGLNSFYAARAAGATRTSGFFTTNLANVKKSDLKKLTDARLSFTEWLVPKEVPIKDFVESHRKQYVLGCGFYQLMKDERIQPQKEILLADKATGAIYEGPAARELLGLTQGVEVKVRPGNHGNFDIFIQSTSPNRKLVRGTRFLYRKF